MLGKGWGSETSFPPSKFRSLFSNPKKNKLFRVSPSTVGRAIGKTDGPRFGAIPETNRESQQYSGTALRASPSTVGRAIGKTDGPRLGAIPETNRESQQYSGTALSFDPGSTYAKETFVPMFRAFRCVQLAALFLLVTQFWLTAISAAPQQSEICVKFSVFSHRF